MTAVASPPVSTEVSAGALGRAPARRLGRIGGLLVVSFVTLGLFGPSLAPFDPTRIAGDPADGPSFQNLLGTTGSGVDVFSQLLHGARTSLVVAAVAGGGALAIGALLGMVGGWFGGRTDGLLVRVFDVVLVIPKLPLLILAGAYVGRNLLGMAVTIALISWPITARVVRSEVLSLRRRTFLKATLGFGAGTRHVLRRHIGPALGPILAARLATAAGQAVIFESGLAFLGLGDLSRVSWGSMMSTAFSYPNLLDSGVWRWWLMAPLSAIVLLILGITFLGVSLEQRANPRLVRHDT
jgi:peptide/nickel transport system permease protein